MSAPGRILFLLHAHLPFVRHPEYDRFFEENWLFEAIAETYIPFVQAMRRLLEKGVPGTLNLSVSPPLIEMLADAHLMQKFSVYLQKQMELIEKECKRFSDDSWTKVVQFYAERQKALTDTWFNRLHGDLLHEFSELEKTGKLNLLTCIGTHPYLPAYQCDPDSIKKQCDITVRAFERAFGRAPRGVWLPECGYFPGLDSILREFNFRYFFLETHGVLLASPPPEFGVFAPLRSSAGLCYMGREQASSMEVWSRRTGYPGHPEYREFFRDISSERERDYLGEYFFSKDTPIDSGLKYYRITGNENKERYRPWNAMRLATEHARLFIANREATFSDLIPKMRGHKAAMLCPYDAELFGHWWFEGPLFLEAMLERAAASSILEFSSADDIMQNASEINCASPALSSWGEGGFGSVWINSETEKYYPMAYRARQMIKMLSAQKQTPYLRRLVKQMERELMLLQSSDWAFMIHNHSDEEYAKRRLNEHYENILKLFKHAHSPKAGAAILHQLEQTNNIFSWM